MRYGGVSDYPWKSLNLATSVGDLRHIIIENRRRIADCLSLDDKRYFDVWQIHSDNVLHAKSPRPLDQPHQKGDAIITNEQDIALLMLFADCVPILLFDTQNQTIALVHAGWKGSINRVVGKTVDSMIKDYGCIPETMFACIGPSICVNHYEVGSDVAKRFQASFIDNERFLRTQSNKIFLDLAEVNKIILIEKGINNIQDSKICTAGNKTDWFSHRAEKGKTGRFAVVLSLRKTVKNNR
jgi:YfiH family protein